MSSKYELLERHLANAPHPSGMVTLTIPDIERILGFRLPPSAYRYPAWWSNTDSHSQAGAWRRAGYEVSGVMPGKWVRFRRVKAGGDVCLAGLHECFLSKNPTARSQFAKVSPESVDMRQARRLAGTIALVSCVKSKWTHPCAARDLYVSAWFRKASAYVEGMGIPWYILSAEHGLVQPEQVVAL